MNNWSQYIPSIISIAGVIITVLTSLWLGLAKQRNENRVSAVSAESAFRDDLLALVERHEQQLKVKEDQLIARDAKIEKRDQQLREYQETIGMQLQTITELTIAVKKLEYEVKELRAELDKFNRKVYYIRDITTTQDIQSGD